MSDYESCQNDFHFNNENSWNPYFRAEEEYQQDQYFLPQQMHQEYYFPLQEDGIDLQIVKQEQQYDDKNQKHSDCHIDFQQSSEESENLYHKSEDEEKILEENDVKLEYDEDEMKNKTNEDNKSTKIIIQTKQIRKPTKETSHQVGKQKKAVPPEQVETKNLAALYARSIIKAIKRQSKVQIETLKIIQKFEKKVKSCTLKTLRDLLDDETIRLAAQNYFSNFQFLDDLLSSEKQQDIKTPIKYLNKMYQGCLNREKFNNWKEQ